MIIILIIILNLVCWNLFDNGFFYIPLACLLLNGLLEASGVFFDIQGVPGIKAVRNRLYK